MNRAERRRLERTGRRWLASVAADPRTSHDELLIAEWISKNVDETGHIQMDPERIAQEVSWPRR